MHPSGLTPFYACRLIALDKCPGVHPIGVCEVARRIISKTILFLIKSDFQDMTDSSQLCANQIAGMEAAVHLMRSIFNEKETEVIILVDASNAFNSLNRKCFLLNIRLLCPAISPMLINTYRDSTDLFLGSETILSEEGTTQSFGHAILCPHHQTIDLWSRTIKQLDKAKMVCRCCPSSWLHLRIKRIVARSL